MTTECFFAYILWMFDRSVFQNPNFRSRNWLYS